jgi:esterase/lipase superfamily enzyme
MFVITNRRLESDEGDLSIFSKYPSEKGANELRLVEVKKSRKTYKATLLDDELSEARVEEIAAQCKIDLDTSKKWYQSLDVACQLYKQCLSNKKHILIFVHGYNNDMSDVLATAEKLETLYNVSVVPFSWPANGGGEVSGAASYLSDKRDARASTGALDRFFERLQYYHGIFSAARKGRQWKVAIKKHPDNHEEARAEYAREQEKDCGMTINIVCHSMGNYLLKYAAIPSDSQMRRLIFDNVCIVAADANKKEHRSWVEGIQSRLGIYIVINENDAALKWSRRKPGEEQLARLGHYLKGLNAMNTSYLNVTDASFVGEEHSYFKDDPVNKNSRLKKMFASIFEGQRPEREMKYRADINVYEVRK